jgi:1,2-diacylglycerol 3-alpha-glucosyltransferase
MVETTLSNLPLFRALPEDRASRKPQPATKGSVTPFPEQAHRQVLVAVIWIDWYAYHVARLQGLLSSPLLAGRTVGIEMVGGIGVHAGLKFREDLPSELPIETLLPGTAWREAGQWKLARLLWDRLSELDPEIVLVPGYYTLPAIAAAVWARVHGTSVLMTESTRHDHPRSWWKEGVKAVAMRLLFGWAVAGGKAHVEYLRALRFPKERIAGFYDVVDNDRLAQGTELLRAQSSAAAHGLPQDPYFLYVGRLAQEKNIDGLLRSWLAYREEGGTWPLLLVGDGPEAASLKALAASSAYAADVHFPGLRNSEQLLPFYAFAGCFVLPSTREPWGLVVNEAMASSLPVLVSSVCGCAPDLVQNRINGFVFNPSDEAGLVALLERMESLDPAQREIMGQESARIVSLYSPEGFGRSVAAIAQASRQRRGSLRTATEESR